VAVIFIGWEIRRLKLFTALHDGGVRFSGPVREAPVGAYLILLGVGEAFWLLVYALALLALTDRRLRMWGLFFGLLVAENAAIAGGIIPDSLEMSRYSLPFYTFFFSVRRRGSWNYRVAHAGGTGRICAAALYVAYSDRKAMARGVESEGERQERYCFGVLARHKCLDGRGRPLFSFTS
jgi:hypothetical protein